MRPLRNVFAIAVAAIILTGSFATACTTDGNKAEATLAIQDVTLENDTQATAPLAISKPAPSSNPLSAVKASIKAGAQVSRTMYRVMATIVTTIARTAFRSVT
jgi:hypothetical protein